MILLLGCGNRLRHDDGAGVLLAHAVGRKCRRPDLEIIVCQQLTPDLVPRLADPEVTATIFADAALSFPEEELPPQFLHPLADVLDSSHFSHHLGPAALLTLAVRLYGRRPPAWLVTIPGSDFSFGEGLSLMARRALGRAEAEVLNLLTEWGIFSIQSAQ